ASLGTFLGATLAVPTFGVPTLSAALGVSTVGVTLGVTSLRVTLGIFWRLRNLGQRHRIVGQRAQIIDDIGALVVPLNAGESHGGARDVLARIGEKFVEVLECPLAAL